MTGFDRFLKSSTDANVCSYLCILIFLSYLNRVSAHWCGSSFGGQSWNFSLVLLIFWPISKRINVKTTTSRRKELHDLFLIFK
jgi:hypothetical protein